MACPRGPITDRDRRCPRGCRKIYYVVWRADPNSEERKNPNEICTRRDGKVFRWDRGPKPPAHRNCRCKLYYAYHR